MLGFAALAVSEPAVHSVLGDPRLDAQSLVDVLMPPGEVDPMFRQFVRCWPKAVALESLPEIAGLVRRLARRGRARGEGHDHLGQRRSSETELAKLRDALRKRFGREVEVSTAVDASLIGGAVIDAGDVVIDGSLRTKLARLGAALAN